MRTFIAVIAALFLAQAAAAQKTISFPTEDGGLIYADVYGEGDRAVVLAHGGRFNKESWEKGARTLASAPRALEKPKVWPPAVSSTTKSCLPTLRLVLVHPGK